MLSVRVGALENRPAKALPPATQSQSNETRLDPNRIRKKKGVIKERKSRSTKPTKYVQELEKEANRPTKKKFKFGKEMCKELEYYIDKYADDYQAMARDKKNIYQDSPGQLRYKIKKYIKLHKE